jgi:hypothetical protein
VVSSSSSSGGYCTALVSRIRAPGSLDIIWGGITAQGIAKHPSGGRLATREHGKAVDYGCRRPCQEGLRHRRAAIGNVAILPTPCPRGGRPCLGVDDAPPSLLQTASDITSSSAMALAALITSMWYSLSLSVIISLSSCILRFDFVGKFFPSNLLTEVVAFQD